MNRKVISHNLKTKIVVLFTLISIVSFSQNGINYQGVARDVNDDLMINTDVTLDINILKSSENGVVVFEESHATTTDVNGVFSIVIGQGVPAAIPYYAVNWAEDKHYLNVSLDGVEVGTTQFFEVPYAYAIGKWQAHKNGVTSKGTGGSIYIGENAGEDDDLTDNNNIGLGKEALKFNISGQRNIAIGLGSLNTNINGNSNIALGVGALRDNLDSYNVAVGNSSLLKNTTGDSNVGIGSHALQDNVSGVDNVVVGSFAGLNNKGSGNVFVGYKSGYFVNGDNKLYIENSFSSSPLIYGEFDNDILSFNAKVGIGAIDPVSPLQIKGGTDTNLAVNSGQVIIGEETGINLSLDSNEIQARNNDAASILYLQRAGGDVYVGNAIVHASDKRLKRDIEDLSYGLETILKLQPKEYNWKGKKQAYKSLGLIAQEVETVIKNVVTYDKEQDKYGVSYTELIPVLIKAIQEQNNIIKLQQKRNNKQSVEIDELENRLVRVEGMIFTK